MVEGFNIQDVQGVLNERKRWARFDRYMARLDNWVFLLLGMWLGGVSVLIIIWLL